MNIATTLDYRDKEDHLVDDAFCFEQPLTEDDKALFHGMLAEWLENASNANFNNADSFFLHLIFARAIVNNGRACVGTSRLELIHMTYNKQLKNSRISIHLRLTSLCWIYWQKPSSKFIFLFQWKMPSIEHFIINEK